MVYRFELLTPYLIVIVSLPSREFNFPIQIRQWCQMQIGVFPFGVHPGGLPCFLFDFFGVQHHRDFEHDFTFSKLRKDLQTRIWDPGVSNYKTDIGGLRPWPSHIYGNLFVFVSGIGILVLPPLKTSMILYTDFGILFNLLFISSGIREMLFEFTLLSAFQNQKINVNEIGSRQWIIKSPSILCKSFSWCEAEDLTPLLFWSMMEWVINKVEDCMILKKLTRLEKNNGNGLHGDLLFLRTQSNGGDVLILLYRIIQIL